MLQLPHQFRPRSGAFYRRFTPGLDLPSWFFYGLRSIDRDFHLVFHPYKVLWDSIINEHEGPIEDPRFTIHEEFGQLNFGFVLKDRFGRPQNDEAWHIWRWCYDAGGVAHILRLEDDHPYYLHLVLNRLHLQAKFTDKYGFKAWNRKTDADQAALDLKRKQHQDEMFEAVQAENAWLTRKAMENFSRGMTAPTNPQKETIMAGAGINYHSRLQRPLEDHEGGLVVPDRG